CAGLEGIRNELRRWSYHAEVLEPAELRAMMAEDARKLLGLYEKSDLEEKKVEAPEQSYRKM
ncbi:MAG: WYL domain-containing protein, partial [Armatimonadetes bacterium]|nr:WYL domain-containing protein [Armatimonadota bacterium]